MRAYPFMKAWPTRGMSVIGWGVLMMVGARAQEAASSSPNATWQGYDWLSQDSRTAASGETSTSSVSQNLGDPFAAISAGSLWQDKYGSVYTRRLDDTLTLSCEGDAVLSDNDAQDLSRGQELGFAFQPCPELTLRGNFHDSETDAAIPSQSVTSTGAALDLESHLPLDAVLTLSLHSDSSYADLPAYDATQTNAYQAQVQQPIGKLPLTAVFEGYYEGSSTGGAPATSLPSLEQSLVWKPVQDTTFQAGLRQQQYQEYPGVDHTLNEALFADWSQKIVGNVSWHSYAEVLNSKGLIDQAPASPIASGANGTAQATAPGSNASLTSSLPVSIEDQTLTFSTGPSFRLEQDISASVEYSDRWDKNPAAGSVGQEQRVSISLKGTF
jgi:hypothetical protein